MLGKPRILSLSPTRLINSIKHEHSCKILYLLQVDCVLKLWKNGFSVDDGPLRDFKADENREFLDSISKG